MASSPIQKLRDEGTGRSFSSQFQPGIYGGRAKYIWFGTTKRFTALTFLFEENEDGVFGAHAYPFDEQTWHRAGLDRFGESALAPGQSDLTSMAYCQQLFSKELDGHDLLRQRLMSDLIRNEVHIPTMLVGGLKNADEVNTLLLAARADLYLVQNTEGFELNG